MRVYQSHSRDGDPSPPHRNRADSGDRTSDGSLFSFNIHEINTHLLVADLSTSRIEKVPFNVLQIVHATFR